MAARMYRIGDYVYCDDSNLANGSSERPLQIRRIDELVKTPYGNGGVEARVVCYFRRRDLSNTLLSMLDRHNQSQYEEDDVESNYSDGHSAINSSVFQSDFQDLSPEDRHYIKHREVFLTRHTEVIPATCIRGKCQVHFFNPSAETYKSYLSKEHVFFYRLIYDPQQRTLSSDRNDIHVGDAFQASVPHEPSLFNSIQDNREELVWSGQEARLSDKEIDQVMLLARSVGTFARALDCTGGTVRSIDWSRTSGLHMSAAAACRDITLFHAMSRVHENKYDIGKSVLSLVPGTGPVLCRDELEDWSASEAFLFEESLDKYGKDFSAIRREVLPWKTTESIVEYYYMWKTTDRYTVRKRNKALTGNGITNKLKQVFIPQHTKPPINLLQIADASSVTCIACSSTQSPKWYRCYLYNLLSSSDVSQTSRSTASNQNIGNLCEGCYKYWKYYGGLIRISYQCTFKWNNLIQTQIIATNTSQRTLLQKCNECGKEIRGKHQLNRHMTFAHGHIKRKETTAEGGERIRDSFYLKTTRRTKIARILGALDLPSFWYLTAKLNRTQLESELCQKSNDEIASATAKLDAFESQCRLPMRIHKTADNLNIPLAFAKPSDDDIIEFFRQTQDELTKQKKRPQLLQRYSTTSTGIPNISGSVDAAANKYTRPLAPFGIFENSILENPDGMYVIATPPLKQTRNQLPLPIIKRVARNPWISIKRLFQEEPLRSDRTITRNVY